MKFQVTNLLGGNLMVDGTVLHRAESRIMEMSTTVELVSLKDAGKIAYVEVKDIVAVKDSLIIETPPKKVFEKKRPRW